MYGFVLEKTGVPQLHPETKGSSELHRSLATFLKWAGGRFHCELETVKREHLLPVETLTS